MSEQIVSSAESSPLYSIRHGDIVQDEWQRFTPQADEAPPAEGKWLVPMAYWLENSASLRTGGAQIGILVAPDDVAEDLEDRLEGAAIVAVDFPAFTDGRGFSLGYLIRNRLGWRGEMRAVGEILIDTVHYLARCGFDSFTLKVGHDAQHALRQFKAFTVHYQSQYANPAAGLAA